MAHPALEIKNLNAWYDDHTHVLKGIDLTVMPGQVIGLLGDNGSGRTTTLRSLLGLTGTRTGSVKVNGVESIHMPPQKIAHLGISYGPDEHTLAEDLSCAQTNAGNGDTGRGDVIGGHLRTHAAFTTFPASPRGTFINA